MPSKGDPHTAAHRGEQGAEPALAKAACHSSNLWEVMRRLARGSEPVSAEIFAAATLEKAASLINSSLQVRSD